jgi:hypothetical protein
MWSWHWSPLTQTSLLLSPSDGLASFLETTLANVIKVVEKVITSKFRFHLIAIYALGCFRNFSCTPVTVPKLPWRAPTPDKKNTINLKTVYILISDVFLHKKMSQNLWATIMPFGPVTNILLAQTNIFGWLALILGTEKPIIYFLNEIGCYKQLINERKLITLYFTINKHY